MSVPQRDFGDKGFKVSVLGLGTGQIGDHRLQETTAEYLLNFALDNGITLFDTARAYGASEERIGKYLAGRRSEIVISTKVGYGIEGYKDWTYDCIIAGVDEALKLMKTDYIDIVHLHSCPLFILQRGEVVEALYKTFEQGKIRVPAYSGENEALEYAVFSPKINSIQTSLNICDQKSAIINIPKAKERNMGVIAKRSVANAPWLYNERPSGYYCEDYWLRWKKMAVETDIPPEELFLRFTAFTDGVDACLVGTSNPSHLLQNIESISRGKLPEDVNKQLRLAFVENDENWIGLI